MANGLEERNRVPLDNRTTFARCVVIALTGVILNVGVRGFLMYSSGLRHEILFAVLLVAIFATALSCVGLVAVGLRRAHRDDAWAAGPFVVYLMTFVAVVFVGFYWGMAFPNLHTYYPSWLR